MTFINALYNLWPHGDAHIPGLRDGIAASAPTVFEKYGFTSNLLIWHLMAQISLECGAGTEVEENLNYSAQRMCQVWPRHFNSSNAFIYAHNPRKLANYIYEPPLHTDLGNQPNSNDGYDFRGRGATQTTGRAGYKALMEALAKNGVDLDLVTNPELVNDPRYFLECGAADFIICRCMEPAKANNIAEVTHRLNGGYTVCPIASLGSEGGKRRCHSATVMPDLVPSLLLGVPAMQIDPKYSFWFGVYTSILLGLATGAVNLPSTISHDLATQITGWCAFFGWINSVILTAMNGYSSNKSGPLTSILPPAPTTVVKVLIAAFALSFLLAASPAMAQTRLKPLTGDLQKDFQDATTPNKPKLITGNAEADMHALWDKLVAASNADLKYASALAGVANTPASAVRKQCYDAILALNTQVNGMNLKDAQGNPLPQPDPKLFTGVEQAAETIDNLSPSGPLFVACAGMAQLTKTNVLTLINAIVTGAAAFAVMPVIPGL